MYNVCVQYVLYTHARNSVSSDREILGIGVEPVTADEHGECRDYDDLTAVLVSHVSIIRTVYIHRPVCVFTTPCDAQDQRCFKVQVTSFTT